MAHAVLRAGADKVTVNTAAVERPELISELAAQFGSQAVVLSMDVKKNGRQVGKFSYAAAPNPADVTRRRGRAKASRAARAKFCSHRSIATAHAADSIAA